MNEGQINLGCCFCVNRADGEQGALAGLVQTCVNRSSITTEEHANNLIRLTMA